MSGTPQTNSRLDFPTGIAVFSLIAIIGACLISGPTYLPCQHPQQSSANQQAEPQRAAPKVKAPAAQQAADQCDDKAPDWWMVRLTFLVILVSAAQFWMFYRQWSVMRESLGDTKKAADAALLNAEAAKKSADALPRMERAYLFLDTNVEITIQDFQITAVWAGEHDFRSSVTYGFKNHGRTPGIVEALHQNVDYWPKGVLPLMANTIGGDMPKGFVISGGGTAADLGIRWPLHAQQIDLVKNGTGEILFWGRVVYLDVFGDRHETGWCRSYDPDGGYFRFFEAPELNYYT